MRRLISDAVQVRPPAKPGAILTGDLKSKLPSDGEVREAMQKLARQIKDTVDSRVGATAGWTIGDLEVNLVELDLGEYALRGSVIIERPD